MLGWSSPRAAAPPPAAAIALGPRGHGHSSSPRVCDLSSDGLTEEEQQRRARAFSSPSSPADAEARPSNPKRSQHERERDYDRDRSHQSVSPGSSESQRSHTGSSSSASTLPTFSFAAAVAPSPSSNTQSPQAFDSVAMTVHSSPVDNSSVVPNFAQLWRGSGGNGGHAGSPPAPVHTVTAVANGFKRAGSTGSAQSRVRHLSQKLVWDATEQSSRKDDSAFARLRQWTVLLPIRYGWLRLIMASVFCGLFVFLAAHYVSHMHSDLLRNPFAITSESHDADPPASARIATLSHHRAPELDEQLDGASSKKTPLQQVQSTSMLAQAEAALDVVDMPSGVLPDSTSRKGEIPESAFSLPELPAVPLTMPASIANLAAPAPAPAAAMPLPATPVPTAPVAVPAATPALEAPAGELKRQWQADRAAKLEKEKLNEPKQEAQPAVQVPQPLASAKKQEVAPEAKVELKATEVAAEKSTEKPVDEKKTEKEGSSKPASVSKASEQENLEAIRAAAKAAAAPRVLPNEPWSGEVVSAGQPLFGADVVLVIPTKSNRHEQLSRVLKSWGGLARHVLIFSNEPDRTHGLDTIVLQRPHADWKPIDSRYHSWRVYQMMAHLRKHTAGFGKFYLWLDDVTFPLLDRIKDKLDAYRAKHGGLYPTYAGGALAPTSFFKSYWAQQQSRAYNLFKAEKLQATPSWLFGFGADFLAYTAEFANVDSCPCVFGDDMAVAAIVACSGGILTDTDRWAYDFFALDKKPPSPDLLQAEATLDQWRKADAYHGIATQDALAQSFAAYYQKAGLTVGEPALATE